MSRNITLRSKRLQCRPLDSTYNNQTYLQWVNDEEITRYLEIFEPYSETQLRSYLESVDRNQDLLFWAVHLKENGKHIGNVKIDPVNRYHGHGEYGIMMGEKTEWGKGYAFEASQLIINYCFQQERLRKITLGVVEDNIAALKLYKKLGFEVEGVYKQHGLYNGVYCNVVRMAIFNL